MDIIATQSQLYQWTLTDQVWTGRRDRHPIFPLHPPTSGAQGAGQWEPYKTHHFLLLRVSPWKLAIDSLLLHFWASPPGPAEASDLTSWPTAWGGLLKPTEACWSLEHMDSQCVTINSTSVLFYMALAFNGIWVCYFRLKIVIMTSPYILPTLSLLSFWGFHVCLLI